MNIFIIVMRIISLICLGSLLICGLYLGANKDKADASAISFHRTLGIVSILVSAVTVLI